MRNRIIPVIVAALPIVFLAGRAAAQVVSSPVQSVAAGWTFNLTPYVWLTTFRSNLNFTGPQGNTVSGSITAGINDYISNLNFAFMGGAEARFDQFSIFMDFVYGSVSFKNEVAQNALQAVNAGGLAIRIPHNLQVFTGSRTSYTVGSVASGYTLVSGDWGNIDALAGLRILGVSSRFNFGLGADIQTPAGAIALSRDGSLSLGQAYIAGVAGVRGRINIGSGPFYVPFYLDAGGGGMPFTWQAYAGLAYRADFGDVSIGYRWLDYRRQGGDRAVRNLSMGGAIMAATFHF